MTSLELIIKHLTLLSIEISLNRRTGVNQIDKIYFISSEYEQQEHFFGARLAVFSLSMFYSFVKNLE